MTDKVAPSDSTDDSQKADKRSFTRGDESSTIVLFYTAAMKYQDDTLTHCNPPLDAAIPLHGLNQQPNFGHGLPLQLDDPLFIADGYDPDWIKPLIIHGTTHLYYDDPKVLCSGCGYALINRQLPDLAPMVKHSRTPDHSWMGTFHSSCFTAHFSDYDAMRFNALKCLRGELHWAVNQNKGRRRNRKIWVYVELVDLFVGVKLSGQLAVDEWRALDWERALNKMSILRLSGKTVPEIMTKYNVMNTMHQLEKLFEKQFFVNVA